MTSAAAVGTDEVLPRRFTVAGRAAATEPARARTRVRAPHLTAVPADATAPARPRPVRGGGAATTSSRPVAAKAATKAARRTRTMRLGAVPAGWLRVVYTDSVDGWILNTSAPSIRQVAGFRYAVPGDWKPFRIWCQVWTKTVAPVAAGALDGVKWLLIHPVRGPIVIGSAATAFVVL